MVPVEIQDVLHLEGRVAVTGRSADDIENYDTFWEIGDFIDYIKDTIYQCPILVRLMNRYLLASLYSNYLKTKNWVYFCRT